MRPFCAPPSPLLFCAYRLFDISISAGPYLNHNSRKRSIALDGGSDGVLLKVTKGGKANTEHKKAEVEGKLKSTLKLPLFTSPLEADTAGVPKVSTSQ